jgi:hypothetical protein
MHGRMFHAAGKRRRNANGGRTVLAPLVALTCLLPVAAALAATEDPIDRMTEQAANAGHAMPPHGYSDFTDPLGRFMDFIAAGAFADARAIEPQACASWRTARGLTALSGRFRAWDTEVDLDSVCASR